MHDPERLTTRGMLLSDTRLILIGYHTMKGNPSSERGELRLARKASDGAYVVHVWHELYLWALPHLGLDDVSDPA